MFIKNRNFIKNVKLFDFKSFIDSTEIGPFSPYSNIIIGPNGTGKSNIFDAILFTFGKKAKNLRMKILTDLINKVCSDEKLFASSSIFIRLDKNLNDKFSVKLKELSLSRKIFKSGISSFYLNGWNGELNEVKRPL